MKKSTKQPILETERLVLRPFSIGDAARVQVLAGNKQIADVTANIPHPYPDGLAESWIATHSEKWHKKELSAFAIEHKETEELMGCISVMGINTSEPELGYWLGVKYWNNGYCTEACREMVKFCFVVLKLPTIHARHLSRNPASGKVLTKSGLSHTGSEQSVCGYRNLHETIELYEMKST